MESTAVSKGAPALMSGATMMALPWRKARTSVSAPIAFRTWIAAASPGPSRPVLIGCVKSVIASATGTSSRPLSIM